MSLFYKMQPVSDNINPTNKVIGLIARAVTCGNIDLKTIAQDIADRSTFSRAEVLGVLEELVLTAEIHLSRGFSVTFGELGTLSVSATSRIVKNENEIRSNSIKVKRIVYRPSPSMTRRIKSLKFERLPSKP